VRKIFNWIGGLLILGALAYYVYPYAGAENRVHKLCSEIRPGMTEPQLRAWADSSGLSAPRGAGSVRYVAEVKTFGRYGCRVEVADGVVKNSRYDESN
jgi:hypothetical protein